jgi:hypothetical protein
LATSTRDLLQILGGPDGAAADALRLKECLETIHDHPSFKKVRALKRKPRSLFASSV